MKQYKQLLLLILLCCMTLTSQATDLAFPGAEGYGRYATGGRGGKTYVVTSLADCSENDLVKGTFRWAVKQPGKKIITFAVNGTIYLTSALCLDGGDITILGQTAPGDGICLADYPVTISCENAIIRYIRIRLGNRQVAYHEGDGFGLETCNNVIIDHCSISWSIDECLSISEGSNITIQWCMIEEALNNAGHVKGAHGYGGNWGGYNVSYHHNLITQCTSRVPRLGGDADLTTADFVDIGNNVYYNWAGLGCYGAEATDANIVNNYYKPGPCTDARGLMYRKRILAIGVRTNSYIQSSPAFAGALHTYGHFYINGNVNPDYSDVTTDNWASGVYNQTTNGSDMDYTWTAVTKDTIKLSTPREFMHVTTQTAQEAYDLVLANAGASIHRDCVDNLMVAEVENRLGETRGSNGALYGQIDTQSDNGFSAAEVENGAWPILSYIAPTRTDTDGDGIPDLFESAWGLDATNSEDGATMYKGNNTAYQCYSYVEMYVNTINSDIKKWNDACTAIGTVQGVDEPTLVITSHADNEHEVSALTYKGYDSANKVRTFSDGVTMSATGGMSGAAANGHTLKLRAGTQYTITVPAGIKATALRIWGYSHYTGNDIYVSELNGTKYSATDYVISAVAYSRTNLTIPFGKDVSGSKFTITFTGNSPDVKFFLVDTSIASAIGAVPVTSHHVSAAPIYNLQGIRQQYPHKGVMLSGGRKYVINHYQQQ